MNSLTAQLWLTLFSVFIVDVTGNVCRESCDVDFETVGCFKDKKRDRALPNYIYQERDRRLEKNYGGRKIDWNNWNEYYPGFACRCAQRAKELGFDIFGLQFYGECWAGNSNQHSYARHGFSQGCIQDDFESCRNGYRYCMGQRVTNMVYRIVDTKCPQIAFEKVGCYHDLHIPLARPLPDYLFNDRDPSIENYSGRRIDWVNWDIYMPQFACRCAAAAKAKNHTFFGMQFYGECWSGGDSGVLYERDGVSKKGCVDKCYQLCTDNSNFCSGTEKANYVYRIKDGSCEINVGPVGCYKENGTDLAMQEVFHNEVSPGLPNFDGNLLPDSSDDYIAAFPDFLCKCARKAAENKWEYFGVRELGLCVRSSPTITNYNKYGSSDQCIEGNNGKMCASGSMLCGGKEQAANYVYKITLPGAVVLSSDVAQEDPDEFFNPRFF